MPMPSVNVTFRELASTAIQRSQKGTLAILLNDSVHLGPNTITSYTEIPNDLSAENKAFLDRAFIGSVNRPKKVVFYVMDGDELTLTEALAYLATEQFDYLVGTPDISEADATTIVNWVKTEREQYHTAKAVLPLTSADHEAIVNFTTEIIKLGTVELMTEEFCSRIAGIIAGTPMTMSSTYVALPEVTDVSRLTPTQMDAAVDAGEFILFHDGSKVKTGRAVNSFITTTATKGKSFKKIKIVEIMDMIQNDTRTTIQDTYIGRFANSYDNKCLLIVAIKTYLETLETEGLLQAGSSSVGIDMDRQREYLKNEGIDISEWSEQQIKEADTGSHVFLVGATRPLDSIEDVDLVITI